MEHFVLFLKGFGVIILFMAVGIAAINAIALSPHIFVNVCGVLALVAGVYVTIKALKAIE
jgi:hypothetical protein